VGTVVISSSSSSELVTAGSFHDAILGDVTHATAGGADDAVGEVWFVLTLPALVVGRSTVCAPEIELGKLLILISIYFEVVSLGSNLIRN
jgi:hypothetical protein